MNDSRLQAELKTYLANLTQGMDQGHRVVGINHQISSENDLDRYVRVSKGDDDTLLKILGYNTDTVNDHPTERVLIGTTQFQPDYVLRNGQKCLAVLDLNRSPLRCAIQWSLTAGLHQHPIQTAFPI